jgi:hypothetical protein
MNADAKRWEEAAPGRWASMLVTDPAHWAEIGIETADELGSYLDACVEKERRKDALDD